MLPSPDQNLKIGSVGRDFFFFFFFFLRTARELSFPIFFFKFLNGENSGGMQSKRIYKSCKCFFKPLNTNFSKFFAQIWHLKKKKKKKNPTLFFRILRSVGRGQHNIFFFWPNESPLYRPYALTSRLHNNDAMLGVKTCRAARTCFAGRAHWRSPSQSVCAPGPARRCGMQGFALWLHAWRWCTWRASFDPQHHGGALLWRHMHMVYTFWSRVDKYKKKIIATTVKKSVEKGEQIDQ